MSGLQVVQTIDVNTYGLTASNAPMSLYSNYSGNTVYGKGDRVTYNLLVYESIRDSNSGNLPSEEFEYWQYVEPTNRYKAFDLSTDTRTRFDNSCYFEFFFGNLVTDLVILGLTEVTSVNVRVSADAGEIYNQTYPISSLPSQANWYSWTFEARSVVNQLIVSDLPPDPSATIRVTFHGGTGAGIGTLALGRRFTVGDGVQYGATLGIQDFSRKERNEYGDTYLVQRAFAKSMSLTVNIKNDEIDTAYNLLSSLRASPCLWIASSDFQVMTLWGYYQNFDVGITYSEESEMHIELEGLI